MNNKLLFKLCFILLFTALISCSDEEEKPVGPDDDKLIFDMLIEVTGSNDSDTVNPQDSIPIDTLWTDDTFYIDTKLFSAETHKFVDSLLALMTLEEKVGQMTQAERSKVKVNGHIAKYALGSLLSGGGSAPYPNTPENWCDMYDKFQKEAVENTRLGIPLIYGIDAVHGHNNASGATIFPHNIGLGSIRNDEGLAKEIAIITAKEISATGIDWTFSPCVAIPQDYRWGRTYEGFSQDPKIVAELGKLMVEGYQSDISTAKRISACAKHFLADGATNYGTGETGDRTEGIIDRGDVTLSMDEIKETHMQGYITAIDAGVLTVMISFSSINGVKCHENKELVTDLLKEELAFEGLVVSDWEAIQQLDGSYTEQVKASVLAGLDMFMEPNSYAKFFETLVELVNNNEVPMSRIDDAVKRILKVKHKLGLFENPYADRTYLASFGSKEHREVAREAVRKSMVLVKKDTTALPIKTSKSVLVVGKGAKYTGYQCGGWTQEWQGIIDDFEGATSLLTAMQKRYDSITYIEEISEIDKSTNADVAVFVVAERPYVEWLGDKTTEEYETEFEMSSSEKEAIEKLKAKGTKIVTLVYCGRPRIMNDYFDISDAVVIAWLPGSEGDGLVDMIAGDYDFSGRLSMNWPATINDVDLKDKSNYNPLFPINWGYVKDIPTYPRKPDILYVN